MTTVRRRTRDRLTDILNGDWKDLDPNTRRALVVLGDEVDGVHETLRNHDGAMQSRLTDLTKQLDDLRRTVISVGFSFAGIVMAAAVGVFFTR